MCSLLHLPWAAVFWKVLPKGKLFAGCSQGVFLVGVLPGVWEFPEADLTSLAVEVTCCGSLAPARPAELASLQCCLPCVWPIPGGAFQEVTEAVPALPAALADPEPGA